MISKYKQGFNVRIKNKILLMVSIIIVSGCSSIAINKKQVNSANVTDLIQEGDKYNGPKYKVGILSFSNMTKVKGFGEKAEKIVGTMLSEAGLIPVHLNQEDVRHQEKLAETKPSPTTLKTKAPT